MVEEYLKTMQVGVLESQGRGFTLVPEQARRFGCRTADPWNFLLLMFTQAVEEGHSHFEVRTTPGGLRIPKLQRGLDLARTLGPVELVGDSLRLGSFAEEAWLRLKSRTHYSPIPLILDGRQINGGHRYELLCRPGNRWGWTLVDRGLSFPMGNLTPGIEVVAQTGPLNGRPWPDNLVADTNLLDQLRLVESRLRPLRSRLGLQPRRPRQQR